MHTMMITLFDSCAGIPTILFYFPEKLITYHHPCTTGTMVIKMNKASIAKPAFEVGHMLG
jgi:hypothetical protein